MADQCIVIEDQLHVSDAASLGFSIVVADHLQASDGFVFNRAMSVGDTLRVSDGATFQVTIGAADALQVASAADVTLTMRAAAADALVVRDRASMGFNETVVDSLVVSDAVTVVLGMVASDRLRVTSAAQPQVNITLAARDALTVRDRATVAVSLAARDALRAGDGYTFGRSFTLGDALTVSDGPILEGSKQILVADALRVRDSAAVALHSVVIVRDELVIEDLALLPAGGGAWTANTDTWAGSRYSGFDLNSLAAIDGSLYGAGPAGLYAIDGADDAGVAIDASLLTDQRSGGPEASLRRGGYLYGTMKTDGLMGARVFDTAGGQRHAHTYTFEERRNDELGPMRVKYGRGVKSLMWQFEIFNLEGADFRTAGSLLWAIDQGSRRV
jgi:hypothetical protein